MIIFGKRPQVPSPSVKKPKQPASPLSFFEEKRIWRKSMAKRKFRQGSRLIPGTGGMRYSHHKMDKILDERFSWDIHKGFISRDGAIRSLKKLRREEFNAATGEKRRELKRERLVLEEGFGLKGKY